MLFYKVSASIQEKDWDDTYNDRQEMRNLDIKIRDASDTFNEDREEIIFVANISKRNLTIAIVMKRNSDVDKLVEDYIKCIEMEVAHLKIEEVGLQKFNKMARKADCKYIGDDEELFEYLGIDNICKHYGIESCIREKIVGECCKETIYKKAPQCMSDETLKPELDRIFAKENTMGIMAHPVHYIIQTGDAGVVKQLCNLLVQSLYLNNRVISKRYSFTKIYGKGSDIRINQLKDLYKSSIGGTVMMYFDLPAMENNIAHGEYNFIEDYCEIIKEYQNKVLTIFVLPPESKSLKELLFANLQNMSFVEIEEDLSDEEKSLEYLKSKAKECNIRSDKRLTNKIEHGNMYYTKELNNMFEEWYQTKLKNTIYSQYKEITSVAKKQSRETHKGTAYEELTEMVGLTEAKNIINKALDYYKAQKLFNEKGMSQKSPALHMVFTGNPGSAKTSVARLFAKILKENKIMPKGHMIEVGRGDLVGKFVGWTAPNIQKKFAEAKGGVLFIDEAYSLVDDKDGCFGDEAINTIVQEMENHRKDVVVIFAGYPREMEKFLNKNPGLRSRIAFHVPFDDYNSEELCDIAQLMAKKDDMELSDDALVKLHDIFDFVRKNEDFGNGRFVRNVLEDARMSQASRLVKMDFDEVMKKDLRTIKACDIEMPANYRKKEDKHNSIGFVS